MRRITNLWAGVKMFYLLTSVLFTLSLFASSNLVAKTNTFSANEVSALFETSGGIIEESPLLIVAAQDTVAQKIMETWIRPEFPGGDSALFKYLKDNIKYPSNCLKEGAQGRSDVAFAVKSDGTIDEAFVLKRSGYPCLDDEALRVIESMPKWKPGTYRGKPVGIRFRVIPVVFKNSEVYFEEMYVAEIDFGIPIVEVPGGDDEAIYSVVEKMPGFPGGDSALFKYLKNNIKYPSICLKNGIHGRTIVKFVVDRDGSIVNPLVLKSAGNPYLDKEALRVVKNMPKWNPGTQGNKTVRVSFSIPVVFELPDSVSHAKVGR